MRGRARRNFAEFKKSFWGRVQKRGPRDCWPWQGCKFRLGYGYAYSLAVFGGFVSAHRAAWRLRHGPIPAGKKVLHRCDNPPCCNPAHLFLGTMKDNALDRKQKGRSATGRRSGSVVHPECRPRGEQAWGHRLTTAHVRRIRALRKAGMSGPSLARIFKVNNSSIYNACNGTSWRHVR